MASPTDRRDRRDSPVFRALAAAKRVYDAEGELITATRETIEAHAAGACLTCGAPVTEPGAKLCQECADDVAEAGAELGARTLVPVLQGALEALLGGRRRTLPPR